MTSCSPSGSPTQAESTSRPTVLRRRSSRIALSRAPSTRLSSPQVGSPTLPNSQQTTTQSRQRSASALSNDNVGGHTPKTRKKNTSRKKVTRQKSVQAKKAKQKVQPQPIHESILRPEDINLCQDSDDENSKVKPTSSSSKTLFDNISLYFEKPIHGGNDDLKRVGNSFKCNWCKQPNGEPTLVRGASNSDTNLLAHRDGSTQPSKSGKPGCKARIEAIEAGARLPPTVFELRELEEDIDDDEPGVTLAQKVGQFDNKTFNQILVLWMVSKSVPWTHAENRMLRAAFRYTNPEAEVHGRTWFATQGHRLYVSLKKALFDSLANVSSKFTIIQDAWTSKGSRFGFSSYSITYINDNWEYVSQHLGFKLIAWYHNGEWLAEPLINLLEKHKLYPKMLSQTTDSGGNNFTMARAMETRLSKIALDSGEDFEWKAKTMHIRCICHQIALIVNSGLKAIEITPPKSKSTKKVHLGSFPVHETLATIPEEDESDVNALDHEFESEIHQDGWENEPNEDCNEEEIDFDDLNVGFDDNNDDHDGSRLPEPIQAPESITSTFNTSPNTRLSDLTKKIEFVCRRMTGSDTMRRLFEAIGEKQGVSVRNLMAGYGIRMNIRCMSWERAWEARNVIDEVLEEDRVSNKQKRKRTNNPASVDLFQDHKRGTLNGIEFSAEDWRLIKSLVDELKPFISLTKMMEGDGPTGSIYISQYYLLQQKLKKKLEEDGATKDLFYPMCCAMLTRVNEFLSRALKCETLVMACILHPSWSLAFFEIAFGSTSTELENATELLSTNYSQRKHKLKVVHPGTISNSSNSSSESDEEDIFSHLHQSGPDSLSKNELSDYIQIPAPSKDMRSNPHLALAWWKAHECELPVLASLARDYLASSASSCAVERTFSAAADVCGGNRGGLHPRTMERGVSSHMWMAHPPHLAGEFEHAFEVLNACLAADAAFRKSHT